MPIFDAPSLNRYISRIESTFSDEELRETFQDSWISTYNVWTDLTEPSVSEFSPSTLTPANYLFRFLLRKGIYVKGVVSERKLSGEFISAVDRSTQRVVYIGKYSYFSQHESSRFRFTAKDRRP